LDFYIDEDDQPPLVPHEKDKERDMIPHFLPHKYNNDFDYDDDLYMMSASMAHDTVE
jgi:hypothetical protein